MRFRTSERITRERQQQVATEPLLPDSAGVSAEAHEASGLQPASQGHQFGAVPVQSLPPKLVTSQPGDSLEQEAERVSSHLHLGGPFDVSRHPAPGSNRDADRSALSPHAASLVASTLAAGGAPLRSETRRNMEPLFGHDFGQVRVHTGDMAARSAQQTQARAFTVGNDIVFGAGKYAPQTRDGDRLLAHELTHVVQQSGGGSAAEMGPLTLARDFELPLVPKAQNAPAEREKDAFPEADKQRARATVIAPLRAAATQLGAGEKADVASVLRHLRPMRAATSGVKWPEGVLPDVQASLDELDGDKILLESIKLSSGEAVFRARRHWADARRELAIAKATLRKARDVPKAPDAQEREGLSQDVNAVIALSAQIDATTQDLVKAPKTPEGFQSVKDAGGNTVLPQFDTIKPPEAAVNLERAKAAFIGGLATIVPLADGKNATLNAVQLDLTRIADRLAGLVGDAAPAPDVAPGDDDKEPTLEPRGPAPSVSPLPPPPPPPPK